MLGDSITGGMGSGDEVVVVVVVVVSELVLLELPPGELEEEDVVVELLEPRSLDPPAVCAAADGALATTPSARAKRATRTAQSRGTTPEAEADELREKEIAMARDFKEWIQAGPRQIQEDFGV